MPERGSEAQEARIPRAIRIRTAIPTAMTAKARLFHHFNIVIITIDIIKARLLALGLGFRVYFHDYCYCIVIIILRILNIRSIVTTITMFHRLFRYYECCC